MRQQFMKSSISIHAATPQFIPKRYIMYLQLGQGMVVPKSDIIGIFDMDNTSTSKKTREFLSRAEKNGEVVPCDDLPKSFLLTAEYGLGRVYLTPYNSSTLEKRLK